jgi:hypothetical protein
VLELDPSVIALERKRDATESVALCASGEFRKRALWSSRGERHRERKSDAEKSRFVQSARLTTADR